MTFIVPFDGSELAEAALIRAKEFSSALEDTPVVVVTVIPAGNTKYARERGWLDHDEAFEMSAVVERLHKQVVNLVPEADFHHLRVDTYAPPGTIASKIRRFAIDSAASMVFLGSENAGHLVVSMSSVGGEIAAEEAYDVVIVRHKAPSKVAAVRDTTFHTNATSDFYTS